MNLTQRIATACLVAAGLASNLGSNFHGPQPDIYSDCKAGTVQLALLGNGQTGVAGAPLPQPLGVGVYCTRIADGTAQDLFYKTVTWTVSSGNGTVNGSAVAVEPINNFIGEWQANWSLGPVLGTQTVTVSVRVAQAVGQDLEASATFSATGTPARAGGTCASGATTLAARRSIAGTEVWTAAGSPYRADDVTVRPGGTLRIDPGVTVCLRSLVVENGGRLQAEGSAEQPVRLTVVDSTRDSWTLDLQGRAPLPSQLRFVQADNLSLLSSTNHALLVEDSRFIINPALRTPAFCAQVAITTTTLAAQDLQPSALRRSVFDGYGGAAAGCYAALRLDAVAALPTGAHLMQSRVQGALADGVAVSAVQGAPAWALSQCALRGNGRDGLRQNFPTTGATLPGATVSGCILEDNAGLGVSSQLPAGSTLLAQRNWWGDPAGPAGPRGDGASQGVDATMPLNAPPVLGY
jgi:hypothetical protein